MTDGLSRLYSRILKSPHELVVLVLLAFFLPMDRVPTATVMGINLKISSFLGLVLITLAAFQLLRKTKSRVKTELRKYTLFLPAVAWLLWLVFGIVWVKDGRLFLDSLLPQAFLVLLAQAVAVTYKPAFLRPIMVSLVVGSVLAVMFGLFQFVGNFIGLPNAVTLIRPEYSWQGFGFPRLHSFSLEPLYFAGYLLLPLACVSAWFVQRGSLNKQSLQPIAYILGVASIITLTLSRGGIIGALVVFVGVAILLRRRLKQLLSWQMVAGVFVGFVVSLALVAATISLFSRQGNDPDLTYGSRGVSTFVSHIANTRFSANRDNQLKDDSIAQRDTARSQGVHVMISSPLLFIRGVGYGQYEVYASEQFGTGYKGEVNNMVIEQIVQGGVIGFLLLVAFLGGVIWRLLQYRTEWLAVALLTYIGAVLVQAQTFHGLTITHFWFAVGIAVGFLTSGKKRLQAEA